ncbi:cation:proton antiporter [Natronosalvus amylolyticus]|uniref:cation:proton antiporter n=1 Tax=Natronosalvus amylolyticus TaxID=2961994 RepID=UPI0020C94808|nr:cation:proton antiporter [Natronosalvus amylolyticus]
MAEALILDLAVMFVAAGFLLLVTNHLDLSPVPIYLIAGVLVGTFIDQPDLIVLAQWGIAFLVFVFGIRVDLGDLQSVLRDGEIAAITQLLVVAPLAFAIGYLAGDFFGFDDPARNAIYFSIAVTLSSTIVGAGLLETEIRDNLVYGRLASSIHFFDDMVAIVLLLVLSSEVLTADAIAAKIGYGVMLLAAGLFVYRHGFSLLVRFADGSDELVLMGSISLLIAFLAAAEYLGISIVIGAFAAGIAIRNDETQGLAVHNGIDSIREFFVTIFFVTVGALVSFPSLEMGVLAVAMIALVACVNPVVLFLAFVYEGYDTRTAFLASSGLNQVSEFSLILAIQATLLGTITDTMFDAIILAAAVTMLLTSLVRRHEQTVYSSVVSRLFTTTQSRSVDEMSRVDSSLENHVIVLGYGRQGRRIVRRLEELDHPYVVMENDPTLHSRLEVEAQQYVFGDAISEYPWEKARLETATLIISTVDYRPVSDALLDLELAEETDVVLRSTGGPEAQEFLQRGATYVSVPDILAGQKLQSVVERILEHEVSGEEIQNEHLETLAELERYGFASQSERF